LCHGANVNAEANTRRTLMTLAMANLDSRLVTINTLLTNSARLGPVIPSDVLKSAVTAARYSTSDSRMEVFRSLVNRGHLVDVVDDQGQSALHIVVGDMCMHARDYRNSKRPSYRRLVYTTDYKKAHDRTKERLELLLNHGADVDQQDHSGRTPPRNYIVVWVCRLLLSKGARTDIPDSDGNTSEQLLDHWEYTPSDN
jgi:ankyrin repeat protein